MLGKLKCAADGDLRVQPASSYRVVLDVDDDFLIIPCPFTYITMSVRTDKASRAFSVHVRSLSSSNAILLKPGSSERRALPASSSRASCVFHSVSLIILYHRISFSLVTIAAGAASLEML